jgi:hypothetical protein
MLCSKCRWAIPRETGTMVAVTNKFPERSLTVETVANGCREHNNFSMTGRGAATVATSKQSSLALLQKAPVGRAGYD